MHGIILKLTYVQENSSETRNDICDNGVSVGDYISRRTEITTKVVPIRSEKSIS